MCLTHAFAGALLGRFFKRKRNAFFAGVLSHIPLDMPPHFDSTVGVEASTATFGLFFVAGSCGPKSVEFWGAMGGLLPDIEVALRNLGLIGKKQLLFPTHRFGSLHGGKFDTPVVQPIFWAVALFALLWPRLGEGREKSSPGRRAPDPAGAGHGFLTPTFYGEEPR